MAWTFNGTGSQVRVPDDAALDIPNDDWSFCGWFRLSDNSDSNFKRILAWGTAGGTPHVQVFIPGTGLGVSNNNHLSARVIGTGGADTGVIFPASYAISGHLNQWIAWTLTHENSSNTTYLRVLDRPTSTYYTDTSVIGLGAMNIADDMYIGANNGAADADRWVGDMAEVAFFPGLFMEVNNFHGWIHGGRSHRFPECSWYVPMLGDREDEWGPSHLTVNTVNVATTVYDHPQLQLITPHTLDMMEETFPGDLTENASSTLNMSDVALGVRDLPVSASSTMTLTSTAGRGWSGEVISSMSMLSLVGFFNLVGDRSPAGNVMTLVQTVETLSSLDVTQDLGLIQTVNIQFPIKPFLSHSLGLVSHTSTPHRAFITDTMNMVGFLNTPLPTQNVAHTMTLVDEQRSFDDVITEMTLTQNVVVAFSLTAANTMNLVDTLNMTAIWVRTVEDADILGHALTWYEDTPCGRKQYSPFQGENTITSDVEAPGEVLQDPQGDTGNFSLYTPYLGVPTNEVVLRKPEMDNRDRNAYTRISQETRGGKLVVYADPNWPKIRTLAVTIIGLTETKVDEMQSFMLATIGEEIGLTDWEGRLWKGFIVNPNEPAVQDGRAMWTVSFEFEGEALDVQQPGNDNGNGMAMNLSHSVTAVIV